MPGSLNPDSAKHQKMIVQMQPVDLEGDQIQLRQVGGHPFIEFGLRQRLEPPGDRRLG